MDDSILGNFGGNGTYPRDGFILDDPVLDLYSSISTMQEALIASLQANN